MGLAFWLFIGAEFVTPLAEEIKKPQRNIPLGMILGLLVIVICAGTYGLGSVRMESAGGLGYIAYTSC